MSTFGETFDEAFTKVVAAEGGYTNDPKDRGNWTGGKVNSGVLKGTKYGISAMSYPNLDIKNLTENQAKEIYYKDFWCKNNLDKVYGPLAYQIFDAAVQHGSGTAVKILQKILGTSADGILGNGTLNALKTKKEEVITLKYIAQRLRLYTGIATFNIYGKGWTNRMANNLDQAVSMIRGA